MHEFTISLCVGLAALVTLPSLAEAQSRGSRNTMRPPPIPAEIERLLDDSAVADTNVKWEVPPRPSVNDFPPRALRDKQSGEVEIACIAPADGRFRFCKALGETPEGYDFAKHAVAIAYRGRMKPVDNPQNVRIVRFIIKLTLR